MRGGCASCRWNWKRRKRRLTGCMRGGWSWRRSRGDEEKKNRTLKIAGCGIREKDAQFYFWAAADSSVSSSDFCQLALGLYSLIALAMVSVFLPRSFWYTTPSWSTMKVMTPEERYSAG